MFTKVPPDPNPRRRHLWLRLVAALAAVILFAAACSDDGDEDAEDSDTTTADEEPEETTGTTESAEEEPADDMPLAGERINFWSTETQPERLVATQAIIEAFTTATGIEVELVAVGEDDLPQLMTVNAASGTLPDVVFHPVDFTVGWAQQGLLDIEAANQVVQNLDPATFSAGALDLATVDGSVAAVPSDGWGQLLLYRKDLFDAAGLAAPDTFEAIEAAAEALHDPGNEFFGITASNDAAAVFTQQTFEQFALANDCQLTDAGGNVTLDSENCVEAIDFYTNLLSNYSPEGIQDVVSTRATYFAGQAAMIVWSPFILDEMANLRDAALPTCDECADNPTFLAENSGIIPAIAGPKGSPAQYGQVSLMGIGTNTNVEAAQAFIEYWLSDGYIDWLTVAPEGKFPMRQGTADNPTANIEAWQTLESGVDRRAVLGEIYGTEVIQGLIEGSSNFSRWGFVDGQGELVAAIYSSLPVPIGIADVLDGGATPEEAAAEMAARAEEEQEFLTGG